MKSRALVFDLYGEYFRYRAGRARLGDLTRVMGAFGVEPATVRTVMTRLRREGWFDSTKQGREVTYALNERSWRLLDNGRTRIFDRPSGEWDGSWTQVLVDADTPREERREIERSLRWWGFGAYGDTTWFSPHDREKVVREMLHSGQEHHLLFLRSASAGASCDRLISQKCWDLAQLGRDYEAFIDEFQPRLSRYRHGVDGPEALVAQVELIQNYRRYPFRDPDLPDVLAPAGWRGTAAYEVFRACHEALRLMSERYMDELIHDV